MLILQIDFWHNDLDAVNTITIVVLIASVVCHYYLLLFRNKREVQMKDKRAVETAFKPIYVPQHFKEKYINETKCNISDNKYESEELNTKILPGPIEVSHLVRTRRYVTLQLF